MFCFAFAELHESVKADLDSTRHGSHIHQPGGNVPGVLFGFIIKVLGTAGQQFLVYSKPWEPAVFPNASPSKLFFLNPGQ